jgi:hypothetical protein
MTSRASGVSRVRFVDATGMSLKIATVEEAIDPFF